MRRLILLRHAKAERPDNVADLDRPLAERGHADSARIGAYLAAEGLRPDHVMISPSRRTVETWDGVRGALAGIEAETVPSLYEASGSRILDIVHSAPDTAGTLLVIGHNPGIERCAGGLIGSGEPDARHALAGKFPTAALAVIDFATERWPDVDRKGGTLQRFVTPKRLAGDPAGSASD